MYKDKEKQKQAKREWARRNRAKGSTQSSIREGSTSSITHQNVEPVNGTSVTVLPPDDELFTGLPEQLRIYANGEFGGDDYRELIHHLKTTPIEQLKTEGRPFIPCWRYEQERQAIQRGSDE